MKAKKIFSIYPIINNEAHSRTYQVLGAIKDEHGIHVKEAKTLEPSEVEDFLRKRNPNKVICVVPSENTFKRVVTLPPVESKKMPEMIKFEAIQQIPFGINEVYWGYKMLGSEFEPKVTYSAVKKDRVDGLFPYDKKEVSLLDDCLPFLYQTPSSSLEGIIAIGDKSTSFSICEKASALWSRPILIGKNDIQKDISDLASEIARSYGFYASRHQENDNQVTYFISPNDQEILTKIKDKLGTNDSMANLKFNHKDFSDKFAPDSILVGPEYFAPAAGLAASDNLLNIYSDNKSALNAFTTVANIPGTAVEYIGKFFSGTGQVIENIGEIIEDIGHAIRKRKN